MSLPRLERSLFFLCLLFLPTQLGKHFWPPFSFIYSLPVDYLSPTIYFWDLLLLALIAVWLSRLLAAKDRAINWRALNLWLFFMLTLLPSFLVAKNLGASMVMFWHILTASFFGLYIAFQKLAEVKKIILYGLAAALIYECSIALLEFFTGASLNIWVLGERSFTISTPSIATFNYLGQVFLRPYATFPHPNVLAAFIVIVLPLMGILTQKNLANMKLRVVTFTLGATTLFLTFSRGAIVVGFVEGFILLRGRLKWAIVPLILILPLLWIRYNSVFNFDSLSILRREELAGIALVDVKSSPVLGVGLNNFINQTASSNLISGPTRFLQPVHNIFLLSLSETGVVGLFGFLLLIMLPVWRLWNKRNSPWSRCLLFLWASITFLGMVDHYFITLPQGQRLLFLVWGLSMLEYSGGVA